VIYVLAYPSFDSATTARIAQFRLANEPTRARLVAPHVTLAFGHASTHAPELIARSRCLAAKTPAFTVTFESVERVHDPFENAHKLFLICGTGADTLTRLHAGLYGGSLQHKLDPDHPFRPHMTVATHATRAGIDHLDSWPLGTFPITALIRALDIVEVTGGTLQPIATAPLLP
jgi:2'-5' RNA ligase